MWYNVSMGENNTRQKQCSVCAFYANPYGLCCYALEMVPQKPTFVCRRWKVGKNWEHLNIIWVDRKV